MAEIFPAPLLDKASNLVETTLRALKPLPQGCSVQSFLEHLKAPDAQPHYRSFPADCRQQLDKLQHHSGEEGVRTFLYAVLVQAVVQMPLHPRFAQLPERVRRQQVAQATRIVDTPRHDMTALDIGSDFYCKELGIATLRLYVCNAQLVDHRSGFGRSMLWAQGLSNLPRRAAIFLRLGGFKPYFEIHTHTPMLADFNESGWEDCYHCCSELYALHPEVLGMFGSSWFYDPALDEISPRLAYLRTTPLSGSAHLLFVCAGGSAIHDSTSTSPTRRKLYEAGTYQPKNYMILWRRADQQAWSEGRFKAALA